MLFENENIGATFSQCKRYRYALWRIWDESKPLVMFIGLNPSTANETTDDATIRRVKQIANNLGYGGVYMMNCFPFVSTDPKQLKNGFDKYHDDQNDYHLINRGKSVKDIIFAWGNFKEVSEYGRDRQLKEMFPNALALQINKNGSPKHPLYVKADIKPVIYKH